MTLSDIESDPLPEPIQGRCDKIVFLAPIRESAIEQNTLQALLEASEMHYKAGLDVLGDYLAKRAGMSVGNVKEMVLEKRALELIARKNGTITPTMLRVELGNINDKLCERIVRRLKEKNKIVIIHKKWYQIKNNEWMCDQMEPLRAY